MTKPKLFSTLFPRLSLRQPLLVLHPATVPEGLQRPPPVSVGGHAESPQQREGGGDPGGGRRKEELQEEVLAATPKHTGLGQTGEGGKVSVKLFQ